MRLVTFTPKSLVSSRVGLLRGHDEVVDLTGVAGSPPFDATDMLSLIAAGATALAWLRRVAAKDTAAMPLQQASVRAPIPHPRRNIFCVGWNYLEHFKEGAKTRVPEVELPQHPVFFTKATSAVNNPYASIPYDPAITEMLDWEAELGVVLGKRGKDISEADAMNHVFGYTVINDVSARNLQRQHGGQWFKGKSLDGSCPMGPSITTVDEIDPNNLQVICRVNGVVKQDSNTSYLYFKIPRLIAELSRGLTLEAGDVISTGTPQGVGAARTPAEYMKAGDVLETEIVGLGLMRNTIGGTNSG